MTELFAINVSRQPQTGPQVQSPAIKVQIGGVLMRYRGAIETDDIVVPILHPDPAHETSITDVFFRLDVNDQATDLAQEFPTDKGEVVILLLEVFVEDYDLREDQRQGINAGEPVDETPPGAGLSRERAIVGTIAHVQAP